MERRKFRLTMALLGGLIGVIALPLVLVGASAPVQANVSARLLNGAWTPTNGPYMPGGRAGALAAHPITPGLALAVVGPGNQGFLSSVPASHIYRTGDGGANWTQVYTAPSEFMSLNSLAFTGSTAYAGGQGVVRSTDAGLNWSAVFTQDEGLPAILGVAVNSQDPATAFAAGAVITGMEPGLSPQFQATVHRTADGGANWSRVYTYTSPNAWSFFWSTLVHPVTPTLVLATYQNGLRLPPEQFQSVILRSASGGDPGTWTPVFTATDTVFTSLAFNPATPDRFYATGLRIPHDGGANLYRSDDAGLTWTAVITDGSAGMGLVVSADGSTLFGASYRSGVVTSTSAGLAWSGGVWPPGAGAPIALALGPAASPEKLYVGLEIGGAFTSTDGAASFTEANDGISELAVSPNLAVHPGDPDTVFTAPWGAWFGWRTTDGGGTWNRVENTPHMIAFAFNPDEPEIVLGAATNDCGPSILRSADGGLNWSEVYTSPYVDGVWPDCGPGDSNIRALSFARSLTRTVYAVGREMTGPPTDTVEALFLRSSDGGLSWTRIYTWAMSDWPGLQVMAADPVSPNVVYAGGGDCPPTQPCEAMLWKSADAGASWALILTTTKASYFSSLVIDYQKPNVLYAAGDSRRVYRSTDGGSTWALIHREGQNDLPCGSALALDPAVPSILYVASTDHIIRSDDGGDTFNYFGRLWGEDLGGQASLVISNRADGTEQKLYAGVTGVWVYTQTVAQPEPPADVKPVGWPAALPGGGQATLTVLVHDEHENWVANGTPVTFTTGPQGSFASPSVVKYTQDGQAGALFTGVMSGTATITVTSGTVEEVMTVRVEAFRIYLPLVIRRAGTP